VTLDQAKTLKAALEAGIAAAETSGSTDVDLTGSLQALDDAARDELQAAIDAHRAG
jgi:hypothetical protein